MDPTTAAAPTTSPDPGGPGAAAGDSLTFVGTATTVLRIGGFTLLTDPNFLHRGQRAYLGWGLSSRRRTDPALEVDQLPALDAVVLSHLHGDHFDRVARRGLSRDAPVVTTRHAARRLRRSGFATRGLATWQQHELSRPGESLTVQAVPAVHAFGVLGALLPPVMGSVLVHRVGGVVRRTVYLTGDTLLGPHLDEVHRRVPQIDAAVIHLGGTRVLGALVTMDGAQGVEAIRRVGPATAVPVHYDDYGVFRSPLGDFRSAVQAAGLAERVRWVQRGSTVSLDPGRPA